MHRFNVLGQIADRLIDLGDLDRARTVLRESLEQARSIGKEDKSAERLPIYLAVALSRLDLPAALEDRRGPGAGRPEERAGRPRAGSTSGTSA